MILSLMSSCKFNHLTLFSRYVLMDIEMSFDIRENSQRQIKIAIGLVDQC